MNAHRGLCALIAAASVAAACGGGTQAPTTPQTSQSFVAGTWTGTLTIQREGEVTTVGPSTWTFDVVPGTNLDADFSGVDCPTLEHSTFGGHVLLTKVGS